FKVSGFIRRSLGEGGFNVLGGNGCWLQASSCKPLRVGTAAGRWLLAASRAYRATARLLSTAYW
ncbi:MAG TPA: hypothetical protein PLI34_15460, partial [Saprospiraceae bacterium]|nr:hypothetical protein [Saprospiraceae bacterium]